MGKEEDEEEQKVLENELELQLQHQKDTLSSLDEALASDPTNPDLLAVHEELVLSIKDAEEGLLHLKRARLLREVESVAQSSNFSTLDVEAEPLDTNDVEAQVEAEPLEEQPYSVGSKCRFRYTDGRWYNGQIVGLDGSNSAKISFLTPTTENMMMCKFFLQQRCRFGTNCRLSHGIDFPISSLKKFLPTNWDPTMVGSSIWANSDGKANIWREAELESWDDKVKVGHVVFRDDGSSAKLGIDFLALSEFAEISDEEETDSSSSEETGYSDYGTEGEGGLGFLESTVLQRGIQSDTAIFAKWENHTRGVASRIMANMGYREGMGLGRSGQGMVDPIPVKILPPKQSLDLAVKSDENDESKNGKKKKRSRGGKRKREKKYAEAARAARDEEESRPDVFSLINNQLAMQNDALNGTRSKKQQTKASVEKKIDRRDLVAYDDEIKDLRMRVVKLEEMVVRNKNDKVVYEAAMRKLAESRKALAEAEAAHTSASDAVVAREKEKKWLKF